MRIFSGVQPTGDLHLGNYLGALRQFEKMQAEESFFCIVDLHAITVKHDPALLAKQTREIAAAYIAAGIDPYHSTIFVQSQVPAHAELAWLLNCVARMGWMERMVQFKDKAGENKERASVGLFTYPILMAADILAYRATHVPVGDDQKQHLNLARDIAEKFNHDYKTDFFPIPEAVHAKAGAARIMSLQNGGNKMSKSDPDPFSRINMSDTNDVIAKKIRRATAHTAMFPTSDEELAGLQPELNANSVSALIELYMAVTGYSRDHVYATFGGKGYGVFKPELADAVIQTVEPIRTAMHNLLVSDPHHLDSILARGAAVANGHAAKNAKEARRLMGFAV